MVAEVVAGVVAKVVAVVVVGVVAVVPVVVTVAGVVRGDVVVCAGVGLGLVGADLLQDAASRERAVTMQIRMKTRRVVLEQSRGMWKPPSAQKTP